MTRRTVLTCDRCRAEVAEGVAFVGSRVPERTYALMSDAPLGVDLCSDCHRHFQAWLRRGEL